MSKPVPNIKKINDRAVRTWCRDINIGDEKLTVEVGRTELGNTVGREGGARMYLSLKCRGGDFFFRPIINRMGQFCGFEMACCGNRVVIASLNSVAFAMEVLLDPVAKHNIKNGRRNPYES